jgi:hypothetical protein
LLWAPPTTAGDLVLVGTTGNRPSSPPGKLFAFDQAGGPVWTLSPGVDVMASAAVSGTRAYVRAGTDLYSIPLSDPNGNGVIENPGEIDWKFSMGAWGGNRLSIRLMGSPTVSGNFVYIGSHDGFVYKVPRIDPTPGDKIMTPTDLLTGGGWTSPSLGDWVASTPTVYQGAVYVGADRTYDPVRPFNAHLYKLNDPNGFAVWTKDFQHSTSTSSPAVAGGKVYTWASSGSSASIYAYDLNGNPLWSKLVHQTGFSNGGVGMSVAISGGYLFTSNGQQGTDPGFAETYPFLFAIKDP